MISAQRVAEIDQALALYGCRALTDPDPVKNSIVNENYRAETDRGPLFVRFHRATRSMARLRREHRAIQWAFEQGLPVAVPLKSNSGETLNEVNGRVVAVFPWVDGHPLKRGEIWVEQAAAMGADLRPASLSIHSLRRPRPPLVLGFLRTQY